MKHIAINKVQISQEEARKLLSLLQLDTFLIDNHDEIPKERISFRSIETIYGLTPKVKYVNHLIEDEIEKQFEQKRLGLLEEGVKRIKAGEEEVYIPLSNFVEFLTFFRKWHSFFDTVWVNIQLVKEFIQKSKIVVEVNSSIDIHLAIYSEYEEETDFLSYYFDVSFMDLSEMFNQ